MSFIPISLSQLEYYLYHWVYFPGLFPNPYSILSLIILFAIGIALIFKGNYSWKFIFAALGAYFGFIFAHYITTVVSIGGLPVDLIYIIGAVIGAVLLTFIVRVFLSLGFSYLAYLVSQTLYPNHFIAAVVVFLIVFVFTYVLYNKVVVGMAGIIGAFAIWFTFINLGIGNIIAQVIAGIMFALGIFLQITEKDRRKGKGRGFRPVDRDPGVYEDRYPQGNYWRER